MFAVQTNPQPATLATVKAVGVDVGYGFVKAVSSVARISFPSVVAPFVEDPLSGLFHDGTDHRVRVRKVNGEVTRI
ncbi:hypothetical protein MTBGP_03430 [Moorella thermoacetica]|uniref:ParM/StbA family protein n=1 Tax=Neomoorella thermoacetica TaxID=1525 RepID=UPI0030D140D3